MMLPFGPDKFRALACLDASGASMSALCAVHCAITPMVATLLPMIGLGILADERSEIALLAISGSLGIAALSLGYRVHRSGRALVVLGAGLGLLASGRVAEVSDNEGIGTAMIVGGGLILAASHLLNHRLCRCPRADRRTPVPPAVAASISRMVRVESPKPGARR